MDFRILGPVEVVEDGKPLALGGPRQRALLALLLLHANDPVSTERLIDELWGADVPASGPTALQNQIARLRKVLGAHRVQTRQTGYAIRVEPDELDLHRYRRLVDSAEAAEPVQRSALLAEAVALWHGSSLSSLPDAPFVAVESARLEGLRLAALEERIDADLELGRHADLVGELASLAARFPLQERLRGQLMLALYRSGRQAEALDVYRETRRLLADELGLEPSQSLRELERAVLAQDPSLDPPARPAKRRVAAVAVAPASGERPRRKVRLAAIVLAVGALGAAGAFAAYAVDRATDEESASPLTSATLTPTQSGPGPATTRAQTTTPQQRKPNVTSVGRTTTAPVTTSAAPVAAKTTPARAPAKRTIAPGATTHVTTAPAPAPATVPKKPKPQPAKATPPPRTPSRPTTTPVTKRVFRIEDDFSSPEIDLTIWRPLTDGTGAEVTQRGGQVAMTIAADGLPGGPANAVGAQVGTQCTFPGDFDARVDFTLFDWPAGANVRVGLNAFFVGGFVGRRSSSTSGDEYAASVTPHHGAAQLDETAGSLRIARVGPTMTAYFWRNGRWVPLAAGSSSGAAVLGLQATADSDFGKQHVRAAFDNFVVKATKVFCPAGSKPPGA